MLIKLDKKAFKAVMRAAMEAIDAGAYHDAMDALCLALHAADLMSLESRSIDTDDGCLEGD